MAHARRGTQQGKPRGEPDVTIVEFAESQARRTTLVVLGILLIFALALATYVGVKQSLKQMRGVTMQSRLEAELRALEVWSRSARTWSSAGPRTKRHARWCRSWCRSVRVTGRAARASRRSGRPAWRKSWLHWSSWH
jgi:hypothetical protein